MRKIAFSTRVFSSYVPKTALDRSQGDMSQSLMLRMQRHHLDIKSMSDITGLDQTRLKQTIFGEKPPISTRGCWTKEAVGIARVLGSEPEVLFDKPLDQIGAQLAMPDAELVPSELALEIFNFRPSR